MKFFRDKLYEDITIPAPPKDDIGEAKEVKRLIANRTAEQEKSIADMMKFLSMLSRNIVKIIK